MAVIVTTFVAGCVSLHDKIDKPEKLTLVVFGGGGVGLLYKCWKVTACVKRSQPTCLHGNQLTKEDLVLSIFLVELQDV